MPVLLVEGRAGQRHVRTLHRAAVRLALPTSIDGAAFLSLNRFRGIYRSDRLAALNALYVDLDWHKFASHRGRPPDELVGLVLEWLATAGLPIPHQIQETTMPSILPPPVTKCLLLTESMLNFDLFDLPAIEWQEDGCYDVLHLDEHLCEIECQVNDWMCEHCDAHFHVLGFSSEYLEHTYLREPAPGLFRFLRWGDSWDEAMIRVARHFGGPDAERALHLEEEEDEALRLAGKLRPTRRPRLPGFQRPEALTAGPVEQAIDLRDEFSRDGRLLLEISFERR